MRNRRTTVRRRAAGALLALVLCLSLIPAAFAASDYDRPGQMLLALTFDDGPGPYSDSILDTLQKHGAKATFFMNGYKVRAYPEQVRRMAAEGHQIANHTYDHPMLTKQSDANIRWEIASTAQALSEATGLSGTGGTGFWLRPPYGDHNARVRADAGVPVILWSVDTQDWRYQSAGRLASYTPSVARNGDIVLMHESQKSTAQGLDATLTALEAQGFEFVTVDELLWRRGITPQAGQAYYHARNTGVDRCARSLWYDESALETHWAYDSILTVEEQGLINRNQYGEFLPNFPLSRAILVTALGRLYGVENTAPHSTPFSDVPAWFYAAPYVAWAKENGVMTGNGEGLFEPDKPVTRQELAVVLARCAQLFGAKETEAELPEYTDCDAIAAWARDGVARCAALGLLVGGSDGNFRPDDTVTRAVGAVTLDRLSGLRSAEQPQETEDEA